MSTMTIASAWPRHGEGFTLDDLDRMPDDGHRYELLDGTLIVSPAPAPPHQRVAVVLTHLLELACPDELVVFPNVSVRLATRSAEVAHVTCDQVFCAERPFDVQVIPSRLVAKLRPS